MCHFQFLIGAWKVTSRKEYSHICKIAFYTGMCRGTRGKRENLINRGICFKAHLTVDVWLKNTWWKQNKKNWQRKDWGEREKERNKCWSPSKQTSLNVALKHRTCATNTRKIHNIAARESGLKTCVITLLS